MMDWTDENFEQSVNVQANQAAQMPQEIQEVQDSEFKTNRPAVGTDNVNADRKKKKKRVFPILILLLFFAGLTGAGIYMVFFSKETREVNAGYERQEEEEDIADAYLDYLKELVIAEEEQESKESGQSEPAGQGGHDYEVGEDETEEDITVSMDDFIDLIGQDDRYYERDGVTYTPDYAKGSLAFVLDIPTAGIKRGVYTGTWEEIQYDLDIWMVTMARPEYVLGETHVCVYGHNHTAQDLSFNNLPDVSIGDEFYCYAESGYYCYEITDLRAEWRSTIASEYCDNFDIGSDKMYIMTCGRDYILLDGQSTRYKDYVVEGTLKEHLTLREYVKRELAKESEIESEKQE